LVYSVKNNNHLINEKEISSVVALSAKELLTKTGSPTVIQYTNNSNSVIEICLEKNTPTKVQSLAVFGAGHISRALMPILTDLPVNIYWIDDRVEQFNKYQGDTSKINIICDDFLNGLIDLPDDIYCLVITYSHQIDYEICEKIISKNKFSYLGMIGSAIKGKKFRDRFINKGYQQEVVDKFTCPIGEKQKFLKSPTSIAVTIAMDLINFIEDKRQSEII
jgi:xanthine dehydrogenase accessory factor